MTIQKLVSVGILSVALLSAGRAWAQMSEVRTDSDVEAIASHLEGIMDTTAQAANSPNFVGVQMTTCRINVADASNNSVYLYQEQALSENLSEPYRQRFLQITPGENNRTDSISFRPEMPQQWTGLCAQSAPAIDRAELGEAVCQVSLRESAVGGFVGSTPAEGCAASVRGAVSITNVVVLHDEGMDTWDRGFDAAGEQVWGAEGTPYRYRRPSYPNPLLPSLGLRCIHKSEGSKIVVLPELPTHPVTACHPSRGDLSRLCGIVWPQ